VWREIAQRGPSTALQDLLDLRPRHRQAIDVLAQPLREVADRLAPAAVDLAGRVDPGAEPGVAELVMFPRASRAHPIEDRVRYFRPPIGEALALVCIQ
jgi:hypothetical protein